MKSRLILAAFFAFVFAARVQAAELVVMATNTTAVPGDKVYTIGVQVTQAEVNYATVYSLPTTSPSPNVVLGFQELAFQGNVVNLKQTTPYNPTQLQAIQSQYIDAAAANNPVAPGFAAGPPEDLGAIGDKTLNDSSWWYFGSSGRLQGANDSTGNAGTVTTNPAADGSGVYTIGPTNNVGATGAVWEPFFPNQTAQPAGMTAISAFYGGLGPGSYINQAPFSDQYVNGVLTVPLAQVVASGDVSIPYNWLNSGANGTQGMLILSQLTYNFLGGSAQVDPHAVIDFSTNTIHSELSSGGGSTEVGGVAVSPTQVTGNGNLTSTYTTTTLAGLGQAIGSAAAQQINFALPGPTVQAWDIQFSGTLSGSNTVVLHYDPSLIGSTPESQLQIEHYVNGQWVVPAGQVVDTTAHTITFASNSFSPFVLSQATQVPEPSSVLLMALADAGLLVARGRLGRGSQ